MTELPLSVVLAALIHDNKILLIRREKGDYVGLWGLPGGKVEKSEHLSQAAVREILEESGIESEFKGLLGFVSEHLVENGNVTQHFLLHVCGLSPKTIEIKNGDEGKLEWFPLDGMERMKDKIIPSDYLMIEKLILKKESNYYDCVIEKMGNEHVLKRFV